MMKHYVEFKILSGECVVRELKDRTLNGVPIPKDCTCYWFFDRNDVGERINVSSPMYNGVVYPFDYIRTIYPGSTIVPFMQERGYSKVLKTAGGKWIPIR